MPRVVVGVVVDPQAECDVRILSRRRNDDLLGAGFEVLRGAGAVGEPPG